MDRRMKFVLGFVLITVILSVLAAGCTSPTASPTPTATAVPKADLTVFAAASLSGAFNETKAAYEAQHQDVNVIINFDGTQNLRAQIEQGARADVFASASTAHMNALKNESYMNNSTIGTFANNKLAVIVPKDNKANVTSLSDLSKAGVKIVIGNKDVPVGGYALQIIEKMGNNSTYGKDYQTAVMNNIVSRETTVNYVVSKVALGEADAGFVYVSDVPAEYKDKVTAIPIPDSLNVIAVYPVGVLKDAKNPTAAQGFIDFVKSADGKAILAKYGFTPV